MLGLSCLIGELLDIQEGISPHPKRNHLKKTETNNSCEVRCEVRNGQSISRPREVHGTNRFARDADCPCCQTALRELIDACS